MYETIADYDRTGQCAQYGECADPGDWTEILSGGIALVARLTGPAKRWSPYVIGGVAAYHVGTANSPIVIAGAPRPFGVQGGVGVEVRPARHTYFIEMRYMGIPPRRRRSRRDRDALLTNGVRDRPVKRSDWSRDCAGRVISLLNI
jgi:hypothetical protein